MYFLVFAVFIGLLSVTSCKRAKVADPDMIGPAGFRIILSGTANPSTLYIPEVQPPVFSNLTVTALDNQGKPVAGKQVVFQDYGFGYFENYEISTVRTTDAAGVVRMTYFIPPGAPVKAQFKTYIEVTLVDDGRLDSATGQVRDSIPIILIPYVTEGIVLHGHVLTPAGNGVGEIPVELLDGDNNVTALTVTRSSGSYEFYVGSGWYGTIRPSSDAYTFTPAEYVFSDSNPIYLDRDGLDFQALFEGGNSLLASIESWDVGPDGGWVDVNILNGSGDSSINYVVVPGADWITVSPSSGTTPGGFRITVEENATGEDRSGLVTISATSAVSDSITIDISQTATDVSGNAVLDAEYPPINALNSGIGEDEAVTVNVYNSGSSEAISYLITPSATWIHVSKESGATTDSFTVTVDPNTNGSNKGRSGEIVLTPTSTGVSGNVRIPVSQDPGPSLVVDLPDRSISAAGGTFAVWVRNLTDPSVILTYKLENADSWLTASPETGSIPAQISITIDPNNSGVARTGILYIKSVWNSGEWNEVTLVVTVTVSQNE